MTELPGMVRPDLQALPQIKDRMTFLYLERCTLCLLYTSDAADD